jgi:hypothetical protein
MTDGIRLEAEQESLLARLVEAHRGQPRDQRHPFLFLRLMGGTNLICHAGFPTATQQVECAVGDVHMLRQTGLLSFIDTDSFVLASSAFTHYEQTKQQAGEPARRV